MTPPSVVDAHVHFWDPAQLSYPWLESVDALRRPFLPAHYEPLASGDVGGVVFVQADCLPEQADAEVDFVSQLAEREPRIAGIVAYADLLDEPTRGPTLARLALSRHVVGIRHNIQGHATGYATDGQFVRGVQQVGEQGFPFDLCVTATQLREVAALVEQCPDVRFVLDHCGKPAVRDDRFDPWAEDLQRLAQRPNVWCKLSGLLTEARDDQRTAAALRPYAEHAAACFGRERMMYGTDWPVSTLGGGAVLWQGIAEELTSDWSADERKGFFGGIATAFYDLGRGARG